MTKRGFCVSISTVMKHKNDKDDPLPTDNKSEGDKNALEGFRLFYEALPFEASYAERIAPRLRRPSRTRT